MCAFCKRISSRSLLFLQESSRCVDNVEISEVVISLSVLCCQGLSDMDRPYMSKASSKLLEECLKV
ncbi:unnamed protein product [Brassica rapa subsp. trilocularis]